ncbi:hypothetical protein FA95DRAFT_1559361 [Auriscalpium vulgare]|uniref:Uncharacterized protein n=1 Tax=Auriscalpium vulgare TaxID=40419 RepID=A0ACB8RSW8_9AGAM|nr:hypothetical protein FA95DRAFT_1559361 [Auriscalpium vulgare]
MMIASSAQSTVERHARQLYRSQEARKREECDDAGERKKNGDRNTGQRTSPIVLVRTTIIMPANDARARKKLQRAKERRTGSTILMRGKAGEAT